MNATQLSLCYMPTTGGQEVYVSQLSELVQRNGISHVIQAHPRIEIDIAKKANEKITMIKIPRGLHRINNLLPTILFRELSKSYISDLPFEEKLILHYGSLLSKTLHPVENTFVVSHGRDWDGSLSGRYRSSKLIEAYNRGCNIICNDQDVSNYIAEAVKINYEFTAKNRRYGNLHYLPNSFDANIFSYDKSFEQENGYFIVIRNLRKSRGVDFAVRAFSVYRKEGGKKEFKIVGGPTSGKYFDYLLSLVKETNMQSYVEFLGQKPRAQIPTLYKAAALSIVPSLAFEGTSLSALESMAVGCPCASTNIGGLQELPTIKFGSLSELVAIMHTTDNLCRLNTAESVKSYSSMKWEKQWIKILEK